MAGPYCAAVLILHLMTATAWRDWRVGSPYCPRSLETEGFVHCTAGDELMLDVANRYYVATEGDLVVATLDSMALGSEVRWERSAPPDGSASEYVDGAPLFPHVYGPLEREAVVEVRRLVRDGGGRFEGYVAMA